MALIQTNAANRPVLKIDENDYGVQFNEGATAQWFVESVPTGIAGASDWTFAMWVKFLSLDNANLNLFGLNADGGSNTTGGGISTLLQGAVQVLAPGDSPSSDRPRIGYSELSENQWYNICGVRDSTANPEGRIYLNGVLIDTGPLNAIPSDLSALYVSVGASPDGDRRSSIMASNLQIWNIALTPQQIEDWAMKRLTGTLPSGLIYYRPL